MSAGFHLKNIHSILTSLASDGHPTVHYWALDALSKVADTAGLAFSGHVSSTLGMLAQLYVAESHGDESQSTTSSNLELDQPSILAITRCTNSVINVLGPDLQDLTKTRNMILTLTYQFQTETSPLIASESLKCLENLSMYAPGQISFKPYIRQLQAKLMSDNPEIQEAALTGLYNAMRKGAEEVLHSADANLEDQIWLVLHDVYGQGIMKNIIEDWVQQSGLQEIGVWVHRVQKVLSKVKSQKAYAATPRQPRSKNEPDLQDEEAAGFAASAPETAKDDPNVPSEASQELLRWPVRCTAMECLNYILSSAVKDMANLGQSAYTTTLQSQVADIIKIAFSASTASVVEIRIQGIQIIGRILQAGHFIQRYEGIADMPRYLAKCPIQTFLRLRCSSNIRLRSARRSLRLLQLTRHLS